jgi:hypothetical protein
LRTLEKSTEKIDVDIFSDLRILPFVLHTIGGISVHALARLNTRAKYIVEKQIPINSYMVFELENEDDQELLERLLDAQTPTTKELRMVWCKTIQELENHLLENKIKTFMITYEIFKDDSFQDKFELWFIGEGV